jgi:hypothetical protein
VQDFFFGKSSSNRICPELMRNNSGQINWNQKIPRCFGNKKCPKSWSILYRKLNNYFFAGAGAAFTGAAAGAATAAAGATSVFLAFAFLTSFAGAAASFFTGSFLAGA